MHNFDRPWTTDDVPPGPYFHGTRFTIEPGALFDHTVPTAHDPDFPFGTVNTMPGEEDDRIMFWATTDQNRALEWAYKKGGRFALTHPGQFTRLYIWEVELDQPEVDINAHRSRWAQQAITSVMAPRGRFVRIVDQMDVADYPGPRLLD